MRHLQTLLLCGLVLSGCSESFSPGECSVDGDCTDPENPRCVVDLDQNRSYCTRNCVTDLGCPRTQSCRIGTTDQFGQEEMGLCVRKVRSCMTEGPEPCNGLDDNCDGVVDEAGCEVITNCLDDAICGAFVCLAPENQATTLCGPLPDGVKDYFDNCTQDSDCPNQECSGGFCAPFCRARSDPELSTECPQAFVCAKGMGSQARPAHNLCQTPCDRPGACEGDNRCVWRDIHEAQSIDHTAVCAKLDPARKPLGAACSANTVAGDDECQYGLCLNQRCTRICGGNGSDCTDVDPSYICGTKDIIYGTTTYTPFVCQAP